MSEWKEYRFEEIFEIPLKNGLTKPSSVRGSGYRMVNMKEIFAYDFINDSTPMELVPISENEKKYILRYDDLLFARQSLTEEGAGKISIYKGYLDTVFESHLIRCRIDGKLSSPSFIYYLFKSPVGKGTVSTIVTQTAAAGIKGSDLKNLVFIFPPIQEQENIALVLSCIDDKIDLLHRQNQTLEKMAETIFRQWFVEEAKEDWEIEKLGKIITISSGRGLKRDFFKNDGIYPVLGANGPIGRSNQFLYDDRLIYTGRVGTLGNIFRLDNEKVWLTDNTLVIKVLRYYNFVYFTLKNSKIEDYNVGSTQPLIRQSDIKEIEFVFPNRELINEFEIFTDKLFEKIKTNQTQIKTLTELRNTLLPKLMSGEVRVE